MDKNMKKGLRIALQAILILAIFYFMAMQVYKNIGSLKDYKWHFNYFYLALSFIILISHDFAVTFVWNYILRKLNAKIPYIKALKIRTISELARYLPGSIWHLLGRTYYAEKAGIRKIKTLTSIALEIGANVIAGLLLFVLCLPFFLKMDILMKLIPLLVAIPIGLVLIHPKVLNKALNLGLRIMKKKSIKLDFRYMDIAVFIGIYFVLWLVNGVAFFYLVRSIYFIDYSKILFLSGAFAVAWVMGFVSLISPGGLGVREGILSVLLSIYMPLPIAIIISLISRVWAIIVEFLFAAVMFRVRD